MKQLTRFEEAWLEKILENELEKSEKWLEENKDKFEAYFMENETIPALKRLLSKIEI
jgi:hypothetical protein